MRIAAEVAHRKFDREVAKLRAQEEMLAAQGCLVRRVDFPEVDAIFLPQQVAHIQQFVQRQSFLHLPSGSPPQIEERFAPLPPLAPRSFGVRVSLEGFDLQPPSVEFRCPISWRILAEDEVPVRGFLRLEDGRSQPVTPGKHPLTGRQFLCLRGVREYHDHPQHNGDDWMLYRRDIGLVDVLLGVAQTCLRGLVHIRTAPALQMNFFPPS